MIQGTISAVNENVELSLPGTVQTVIAQAAGTWAGTLVFEVTVDGGVSWFAIDAFRFPDSTRVSLTTANGQFALMTAAADAVRVRASALTSGSATVSLASSSGLRLAEWLAGSGSVGPSGPIGLPGDDGEPGEMGFPGAQGSTGSQGPAGAAGATGPPGFDGLEGEPGEMGQPGPQGPTGPQGLAGAQGAAGSMGLDGLEGEQGEMGLPGPAGATGSQGAVGPAGAPGPPGLDAEEPEYPYVVPGPQGPQGSAGGGGASATIVEVNFGSTPVGRGRFTITDAGIGASSKVLVWQAPGPYTGKGTRADEAEMEPIKVVVSYPAAGSAVVVWESADSVRVVWDKPHGQNKATAAVTVATRHQDDPMSLTYAARLGKVKGNFKFAYMVLS